MEITYLTLFKLVDIALTLYHRGYTPMHMAVWNRNTQAVRYLLKKKVLYMYMYEPFHLVKS